MSVYDKTKFYWYQLTEDFFRRDNILWLEEQNNGKEYVLLYLKLCSMAIKTNGLLLRDIGNFEIPYTNDDLSKFTNTKLKIIDKGLPIFEKMGLITILENKGILINGLEDMVGEKSKGAFRRQKQRRIEGRQKGYNLGDICPPEIELEKEKDIEIDLEEEKDIIFNNNKELFDYDWLNDGE